MNTKDFLLDKLIKLEITNYRLDLCMDNKNRKAPLSYFNQLRNIYSQLTSKELLEAINRKTNNKYVNK